MKSYRLPKENRITENSIELTGGRLMEYYKLSSKNRVVKNLPKLIGNRKMKNSSIKRSQVVDSRIFTLIELMIVISIIAILAALLLPVLNKAREKAYEIQCVNRIKQLNQAVTLYCDDYNSHLPILLAPTYHHLIEHYLPSYLGKNAPMAAKDVLKFCCPVAYRLEKKLDRHVANADIFPFSSGGAWLDLEEQPIIISKIKKPTKTFTFHCAGPVIALRSTYIDRLKIGWTYCNVGLVHSGMVNIGFIDGHVGSQHGRLNQYLDVAHNTKSGAGTSSKDSSLWE